MRITDVKNTVLLTGQNWDLSFFDEMATAEDIATCIKRAGEVQRLTINSNNLTKLPISLKNIVGLRNLTLRMSNLEHLADDFFEDAEMLGQVTIECPKLQNLPSSLFQSLTLTNIFITANATKIPEKINLPFLLSFRIDSPFFRIPDSLYNADLQHLTIKSTELTEITPAIQNSINLNRIQITAPLNKTLPNIKNLMKLVSLELYHLKINEVETTEKFPENLQYLVISNQQSFDYQPHIGHLKNLQRLSHQWANNFLSGLEELTALQRLHFHYVKGKVLPEELKNCNNLEHLHVLESALTEFPTFIFELKNLKTIEISGGDIEYLPMDWPKMPALQNVVFRKNKMAIQNLAFTESLPNLKSIDLSGNILLDRYALQTRKRINLRMDLSGLKFVGKRGKRIRGHSMLSDFQEFAAALAKTTLPQKDKNWFYDLVWNTRYVDELPELSFPKFLMALNINYKPLRELLSRKLIMEVLFQHLYETDLFQNPVKFEPPADLKKGDIIYIAGQTSLDKNELIDWVQEAGLEICLRHNGTFTHLVLGRNTNQENIAENSDYQVITENALRNYLKDAAPRFLQEEEKLGENDMTKNVSELLNHLDADNVKIGLATMQGGGVPKQFMEPLLLMAKCDNDAEIRKDAKSLLEKYGPKNWQPLLKNRLEFHTPKLFTEQHRQLNKKLRTLGENIPQDLFIFFVYLLQSQSKNYLVKEVIENLLYELAEKMSFTEQFLEPNSVVFVNGTTRLKKTEIKEKLESVQLNYTAKYSDKVTHVLIGGNPKFHEIDRSKVKILTENHLQKYLSHHAPQYLEETDETGDDSLTEGLKQLLESEDYSNAAIALEMMEGGGVPTDFLPDVLVISKSAPDAKVRAKGRKLLELYAPTDWLPMIKSKLFWRGINQETKESAIKKRLDALAKETSYDLAAVLAKSIWHRHKKGLRFLLAKSNKRDHFKAAIALLMDGTHLNYSKGLGYKNMRNIDMAHTPFLGYKVNATFPKYIKTLAPIESIDFHNCKYSEIPGAVYELKKLKKLDFSFNYLTKLPTDIAGLENLEELNLRCNKFEEFPTNLQLLTNLKKVDLRHNWTDYAFHPLQIPAGFQELMPDCEILV